MKKHLWAVIAAVSIAPLSASASDLDFNGFLSAGGGFLTEDTGYAGYDDKLGFKPETIIGFQLDATLSDKISVTGQLVARGEDDFKAELEWAYIAYQATENLQLRLGRLRTPFFVVSDYLEVGYAYNWIRPPVEVYGNIPFSSMEGADLIYSTSWGDWDHSIQTYVATNQTEVNLSGVSTELNSDAFVGVVWDASWDSLTLRAGYHRADISADLPPLQELTDVLRQLAFDGVADSLLLDETEAQFFALGAVYDPGDWFLRGEYTETRLDRSILQDNESWYVSGGIRHNSFTYHLTYAESENAADTDYADPIRNSDAYAGLSFLLEPLAGAVDGLIASQAAASDVVTIGVRWDFHENTAFKLEYSQINREFTSVDDFGLVSFSIDVVF